MKAPIKPAASILYQPYAIETVTSLLARLPDPDLILEQSGLTRADLRKLETDDEISAALETRREAVIATPWRLDPFEGDAEQWLWTELEPHMDALLRGAWSAIPYGYSVLETVYRKVSGRIGIEQVSEKPLEWFEPRHDGQLLYSAPDGHAINEPVDTQFKFLLSRRNPTYRNPYGEPILTRCYWPWFFRHNGWRFWMTFMERFADPLLLGQVYSPAEFVSAMSSLGMSAVVGVGKDESVSAITQGQGGEFERVESVLRDRIQRVILGQTLTSQIGASGSYAAAKVHNEVRDDKRRADLRIVSGTAQTLVNALWTLNQFPGSPPAFILQDDTGLESDRATRDATLVNAGILKFTPKYIQSKYDLEPDDFELPQAAPQPVARGNRNMSAWTFSANQFSDQQALDAGVDKLAGAAKKNQGMAEEMLKPVIDLIQSAESFEEVQAILATAYPGMSTDTLEEQLARALFAADAWGRINAE